MMFININIIIAKAIGVSKFELQQFRGYKQKFTRNPQKLVT